MSTETSPQIKLERDHEPARHLQSNDMRFGSPVLQVTDLGKEYRLYDTPRARLKALLTGKSHHRSHWALHKVSFELRRGQCMGVIGDNGAGKSSLLKLVTGTLQPTTGAVVRSGRITAILELGAGFHPDFSGRDNLYFGGSMIGIPHAQMQALEAEVIAFSELGDAIDRPVKTYSSGMAVRLAFALVTAVEPDVLIIDEALAVGDQHFQKKCTERIEQFRANGCTILFCSHSLYHVKQLCDVALWLDGGKVRAFGSTEVVLAAYESHVRAQESEAPHPLNMSDNITLLQEKPASDLPLLVATARAGLVTVVLENLSGNIPAVLESPDFVIRVVAQTVGGECPSIGVLIEQAHGTGVTSVATHADGVKPVQISEGLWQSVLTFPNIPLHSGEYDISVYLFDSQGLVVYEERKRCIRFMVVYPSLTPGVVRLPHTWT